MRLSFTIFSLLLLMCTTADAQKLTGIWRGYFSSSPLIRDGLGEERYKYEVQIEQKSNNSLAGVTYSYKSTVFYGKAELTGLLTMPAKSVILRETKLVELKIGDKSEPCLMTCYLDYTRIGKLEVLEGTFISTNMKDNRDCGSGKVYLERVQDSDFEKEAFLVRKSPAPRSSTGSTKNNAATNKNNPTVNRNNSTGNKPSTGTAKTTPAKPATTPNNTTAGKKPSATTRPQSPATGGNRPSTATSRAVAPTTPKPAETAPPVKRPENMQTQSLAPVQRETTHLAQAPQKVPVPPVLRERENKLVRSFDISNPDITIELYDNGTIDNDTISVYHNNQLVVSKARLTYSPITVTISCTPENARHEFVMVAENLGEIPPNTAIMVIKLGKDKKAGRQEVFLTANEQKNAKVVINYVGKE